MTDSQLTLRFALSLNYAHSHLLLLKYLGTKKLTYNKMYSVVIYNKIKFKINLLNKDVIKVPCILLYFLYYYNFYQMK